MKISIINGELVMTPIVATLKEQKISSLGERLVKNSGGKIDSGGNYGATNTRYIDSNGGVSIIKNPRHIKQLSANGRTS